MARGNGPDVYRGRRKKLYVRGIVCGAIVALLLLVVVLFFGLQKYIVFEHDGISVVLPGAESAGTSGGPGGEGTLTQVNAALTRGGLFLSGERIVLRVSADLFDAYSAQESITRALEYSAGVMKHFWTQMEACAKQSGVFQH